VARLGIVSALGDTMDSISQIQDPTTKQAAAAGVDQANAGIRQIASAIIAGQAPPQAGRDTTEAGLTAAGQALAAGDTYVHFLFSHRPYHEIDANTGNVALTKLSLKLKNPSMMLWHLDRMLSPIVRRQWV
jgi:hypothetical protein